MPIDFPDPETTTTYQHIYNGITQNWIWGASLVVDGAAGPSAWIAQGYSTNPTFKIVKITGTDSQVSNTAKWVYDYQEQHPNLGSAGTAQNLYEVNNTETKAYGFPVNNSQELDNNPNFFVKPVPTDTIVAIIPTGYGGGEWFMAPNPITGNCG